MISLKCLQRRFHSIDKWFLVLYVVFAVVLVSINTADGLSTTNERDGRKLFGGYRITPKFCKPSKTLPKNDPRAHGPTICMFNHECLQREGEVVGACMDGFLFGACCQLSGSAESIIDEYNKPFESVESFNGANNHVPVSTGGFAGSDSVLIETTRPTKRPTTDKAGIYLSSHAPGTVFSPELPTHMVGSHETTIPHKNRPTHTKSPTPRPKPTTNKYDANKYVLVQTLTNSKNEVSPKPPQHHQQQGGITDNEIESIESIILMLNDTKTGPQYNSGSSRPRPTFDYANPSSADGGNFYITTRLPSPNGRPVAYVPPTTKRPPTQQGLTYTQTSNTVTTSVFSPSATPSTITTLFEKLPTLAFNNLTPTKNPSTSYVYSTTRPKRPPQTTLNNNRISSTTTSKKPLKVVTTQKKPVQKVTSRPVSTSYVSGPTPERPTYSTKKPYYQIASSGGSLRPVAVASNAPFVNNFPTSTPAPTVIVLGPYGGVTDNPSPTIHITPKPTASYISTSTSSWTANPDVIKFTPVQGPGSSTSYIYNPSISNKPSIYQGTTPAYGNTPVSNDFDDAGYYGVASTTQRPLIANIQQTVTSASIYAVVDDNALGGGGGGGIYGPSSPLDDFNNFPPVRNPNLNSTGQVGTATIEDYDISTPPFIEDDLLNDKMSLLVNKIVESLKDNFHELADVVENKTLSSARPTTIKRPTPPTTFGTKRPPQRTSTRRPATGQTATRPTRFETTTRPVRRTTRKPSTSTILTTSRPITKLTSTRRPTTRPTRRPAVTTVTYGGQEYDATESSSGDEGDDEDVGEEEESTAFFENGRIQCGVRPHVKSGRIVGGKGATFGEWPWQVLVRESTWLGLFTKNKCGGVLITKNFVMTAAHCQPGFLATLVAVFGEYDISGELEKKRSVTKNIKRIVVHREYDAATFENDLALLEMESPIHYDTHIVPVCMPSDGADFTGRMATVTGWGRLKYNGGVPSVLQEVQVPIIENSVCQEMFHTAGHNKKILPSFLCAGYANGQKDSCEGDSGGPLVMQRQDGRWELAGTVSHGIKCAAPYLPGVYMRTTYYKPWLESVTGA